MKPLKPLFAVLLLTLPAALSAAEASQPPAVALETDARLHADGKGWRLDQARITDPKLPRVLLMGDSILNGYLKPVTAALAGRASVDAWVNPYCQTSYKLDQMIAEVLTNGPYAVIHFNMGLHGWQQGRIKEGQFEPSTRHLVESLRQGAPQAQLIWASITPVTVKGKPGELDPAINPIIVAHNRLAAAVMKDMHVPVNDFYALLAGKLDLARGDQFHWTAPAYKILAEATVRSILQALPPHAPSSAHGTATKTK